MPPISPITQGFMQPAPTGEDARALFEQGFSQMAQNILSSKFPDLMDQVVTFKVQSSDVETGSAVGAFVLSRDGITIHVPVILAGNQIKPIEIMYVKDKGVFLPLQRPWLDELDRGNLDALGTGVKPPEHLPTNIDIRTLVIPPNTGRFSYAAAPGSRLTGYLAAAPNYVKKAFACVLEKNKNVLKFAFEHFDRNAILGALQPHPEKVASASSVEFLTRDASEAMFRKTFGKQAATAYQTAVKNGYVVRDVRKFTKLAIEIDEPVWLTEANSNGFYRLRMRDGGTIDAVVIPNPQPLVSPMKAGKRTDLAPVPNPYWEHRRPVESKTDRGMPYDPGEKPKFMILTEKGDIATCTAAPVGVPIPESHVSEALINKFGGSGNVAANSYGVFVRYEAGKFSATEPVSIRNVTTDSKGVRRITVDNLFVVGDAHLGARSIVTDPNSPVRQIVAPRDGNVTYVPPTFKFIKGTYMTDLPFVFSPDENLRYHDMFRKTGALEIRVKNAGSGMFSVHGLEPETKIATIRTLIEGLDLRENEAMEIVKQAQAKGAHRFFLASPRQLARFAVMSKMAQDPGLMMPSAGQDPAAGGEMPPPGMDPNAAGGMPPGDPNAAGAPPPGMDPAMGGMPPGMDPSMGGMPPMAPPPPDPIAAATAEIGSQLASQAAQLSQQLADGQKQLADRLQLLDAVQQRATQIASEMAGMPPEEPIGPPPLPVENVEAGPEDMMGGGAGPGMGMGAGSPEEMAMQAEMPLQQAAELGDEEAFESTAIGAMASNPDLRGVVSQYVPTLEESLDNLARILVTLWMQEDKYRAELGEKDYSELEDRLRTVFNNLGTLVLKINQTAMAAKPEDEIGA